MVTEHVEHTFIAFKPDAVQRGLIGEILQRFEKAGFRLAGMKLVHPTDELLNKHYDEHVEKDFFPNLKEFMQEGPVLACVLEGVNAVERVRTIVGPTDPSQAPPGTIRGDYAHVNFAHADARDKSVKNLIHASGNQEEADKEINIWFEDGEIHDYQRADFEHVL